MWSTEDFAKSLIKNHHLDDEDEDTAHNMAHIAMMQIILGEIPNLIKQTNIFVFFYNEKISSFNVKYVIYHPNIIAQKI
jgi:hypothetical protein